MNLDWCSDCGGRLELVDGTDPDVAQELGGFEESYRCTLCGGTGVYAYTYETMQESGTGVVQ